MRADSNASTGSFELQAGAHTARFDDTDLRSNRWGVILAGGDGTRLRPLTRRFAGDDRPKQFCAVMGSETLLEQTRSRVSRIIRPGWPLLVLTGTHERFYASQVADAPSLSLLIQPSNQGTAPAILYSLMRLRELDPSGIVAFFPSDHYFADEVVFVAHIDSAFAAAVSRPECVVLLGVVPEAPEVEYGWIEPGALVASRRPGPLYRVGRFWEKPTQALASALMEGGWLWNSFVMVGHVQAFLKLIRRAMPRLVESFESIRRSLFTTAEKNALRGLYSGISASSFSHEVLSMCPSGLLVLRGTNLGWSDLGEPSRVLSILERIGARKERDIHEAVATGGALVRKSAGQADAALR